MDKKGLTRITKSPLRGFSVFKGMDRWLVGMQESRPRIMVGLQLAYQALSATILIWFGVMTFKLMGVAGGTAFLSTAFAGLALQTTNPAFFNGTVACVLLLMMAYGLLSLCLVSGSRVLCDAAALYCLFFSQTVSLYQLEAVTVPAFVIFLIWAVHRLVLGTIIFHSRKVSAASANAH